MNAAVISEIDPPAPHWISRSAFQIVSLLFFSTQTALAVAIYHRWFWLALPLALIVSHFMHGLLVGLHEASHGMLRKNRMFNEAEGILLSALSMMSFTLYRVVHQTHHAHLASERDQEMWPLVQTKTPRWSRRLAAFCELNLAIFFSPFIFLRAFLRPDSTLRSARIRRRIWIELALSVALWSGILWAVAYWNVWTYFFWMYLGPAVLAANLQSWRKYIEHVGLTGSTPNSSTRSIASDTLTGRLLAFTLLHEPFHGVHHQRAGLTHAELPQHVAELEPKAPFERAPYSNYRDAFRDLVNSLSNPRAGAQWRARDASPDALSA